MAIPHRGGGEEHQVVRPMWQPLMFQLLLTLMGIEEHRGRLRICLPFLHFTTANCTARAPWCVCVYV